MPTAQNTSINTLRFNTTSMGLISHMLSDGSKQPVSLGIDIQNIGTGASLWYPDDCVVAWLSYR